MSVWRGGLTNGLQGYSCLPTIPRRVYSHVAPYKAFRQSEHLTSGLCGSVVGTLLNEASPQPSWSVIVLISPSNPLTKYEEHERLGAELINALQLTEGSF